MTEQEKKELQERVKSVIERVNNAAVQAGRDPSEITLVAATKMNDAERVQAAIEAGIRVCGENRVQELQEKYEQNAYDGADLQFIGTLQTNKVKYLIGKVSLIQSVGSVHLGEAIAKEAEKRGVCQDILLEVNIGREAALSTGVFPNKLVVHPQAASVVYRAEVQQYLSVMHRLRQRKAAAIPDSIVKAGVVNAGKFRFTRKWN